MGCVRSFHDCHQAKAGTNSIQVLMEGRRPLLIEVQSSNEVGKQAVNADIVNPVSVLLIRVLMEVEMQVPVLIAKCVGVNLQNCSSSQC